MCTPLISLVKQKKKRREVERPIHVCMLKQLFWELCCASAKTNARTITSKYNHRSNICLKAFESILSPVVGKTNIHTHNIWNYVCRCVVSSIVYLIICQKLQRICFFYTPKIPLDSKSYFNFRLAKKRWAT